jgi:hypothetical protein
MGDEIKIGQINGTGRCEEWGFTKTQVAVNLSTVLRESRLEYFDKK